MIGCSIHYINIIPYTTIESIVTYPADQFIIPHTRINGITPSRTRQDIDTRIAYDS